jgi:hypothetical protein
MKKTRLKRERGELRPAEFDGHLGSVRFTDRSQNSRTRAVGPDGLRGMLQYGPSTPGPFGEVIGLIDEAKVVFRYLPWGAVVAGRHAFEVRHEGAEYVLVSRGRRPTPQLETPDGTVVATFAGRTGTVADSLTPAEYLLAALIAGSGIGDVTLPQSWNARN